MRQVFCAILEIMTSKKASLSGIFSAYFKEVIYGGIDGIVTTFAVVAGFAGASLSNNDVTQISFLVVMLFGLANLFADAVQDAFNPRVKTLRLINR